MKEIPNYAPGYTAGHADRRSDANEDAGAAGIERLNLVRRVDEMNPEDEIEQSLRNANCNERRPERVPERQEEREGKSDLKRVDHDDPLVGSNAD